MSTPTNTAAYFLSAKSPRLEVKSAPYTTPGPHEIVIKNHAIAINPVDWMKQEPTTGAMIFSWIKYPFIFGTDCSGTVVSLGPSVTRFKIGDRVVGHAAGMSEKHNSAAQSAFQEYVVLLDHMTAPIPKNLAFEAAAVLPLGLSTAACGLFQVDQLNLQHPTVPPNRSTGKTLLVWGGSTSVGSNAIQLAVAAGYEVITTSSPRNFDYVKNLGASQVFDYNSPTVIHDVIAAFRGRTCAGALSIGHGAADACMDILSAPTVKGDKFIAMASYPMPPTPPKHFVLLQTIVYFVSWTVSHWFKSKARGIRSKLIFGDTLIDNGVGKVVYEDFLPKALAEGEYVAAPEPLIVGKGLEFIQQGLKVQRKGMSAKKVVVSL